MKLPIVHLDEHLVAVHKPSGMLVHRSELARHERVFALQLLRDQLGRRVHPVHRLDRGTSGLLVFAFEAEVAASLGEAFAGRRVRKDYLAVVRGVAPAEGLLEHPLRPRRDEPGAGERLGATPQPAVTAWRRLAECELPHAVDRYPTARYSLVAVRPQTGRRHQVRRHLKHLSHPVIGDTTHGKSRHNRLFEELFGVRRLLLAGVRLRFTHPVTGGQLDLREAPSPDFRCVLAALGWEAAADAFLRGE